MWNWFDLFLCVSGIVCTFVAVYTIKESYENAAHDRRIKDLGRAPAKERDAREKRNINLN